MLATLPKCKKKKVRSPDLTNIVRNGCERKMLVSPPSQCLMRLEKCSVPYEIRDSKEN